ncbi:putative histone-lysine N-methyltransferase 1 isoform X2 [Polistes fuscatus]|uniref:putative histone-lysine N-methyltransferase 1 isoform X2 n=1 Tax=Polistes fuscatus TaxID=30207 RepID=UPI001CAA0ACD|nr:putative histone-lysine N-methyltransferase 1 isoform X2 [Polistes fuscatus]
MKKSRKSRSGGSSILKVALRPHSGSNISFSSESPSTSKVKRRVSFAEKNHVKEFLSAEQGTLWDNTYEELSNINTGQVGINNQNHETFKNTSHSTSNGMIENENENLMNDSLELTECFVTPGSLKSMHTEEILLNKSISLAYQNETDDKKINMSIESNRNIDICTSRSINVYNDLPNFHNIEDPDLNKTCIKDVSMEITEIPSFFKLPNVSTKRKLESEDKENIPMSDIIMESIQQKKTSISTNEMNISDETQYFFNENLEFTECLQSIKEPLHLQQKLSKISAFTNNENMTDNQTQIFKNVSMEMTCAIPTVCKTNSKNHNVVFHDALMDDKSVVTSVINQKKKSISKDISHIENDTRFLKKMFNSVNETKLMDAAMEITEGVYSLPHSTRVNNVTDIAIALNCSSPTIKEKTVLNDDSLEFTVPVDNLSRVVHNIDKEELHQVTSAINDKTELNNDSLEFTVPVNNLSRVVHNIDKEELHQVTSAINDKTELNNDSLEFTVPVNNLSRVVHNIDKEELHQVTSAIYDKTELNNDSLEFTVPVNNLSRVVHNIDKEELHQVTEMSASAMSNQIRLSSEKEASIIKNKQSENSNVGNQILNTNEKLEKNNCLLDSMYKITRDHSMDEVEKPTNIQFNSSNDNIKKSVHQKTNDTLSPYTTYYNDDLKEKETAHNHHTLTSLISSFVYADMIEDDSFVKTTHTVQQETQSSENVIDVNSVNDMVNVQTTCIQCPEICITNDEQIVQQSENDLECNFEDNNIQVGNVIINKEKNNQHDSDKVPNKINEIHENVFENKLNNKRLTNTSIELEVIQRDKKLDKKDNIENDSAACIIKSKKNSSMDISECANTHSSNNQIVCRSSVFSPTLISAYNQNKTCIEENNITPIADTTDLICSMYITQNNEKLLREEVALEKNTGENSSLQEDKFSLLISKLKNHMLSDDCIWNLCYENIDKQMIIVGFISTSLLIVIKTQNEVNTNTCRIKDVNVISRLENDENLLLSIAHKLLKEKINLEYIRQSYIYEEDIIPLLNHISEDVKFILDFIFDLQKLDDTNLMEISTESITFILRSKCMDIILKITMDIKLFDKINSSHIKIVSILGTVIEEEIQKLLLNVKRDHKFLRRYMSDIKDYIDIIEQVNFAKEMQNELQKETKRKGNYK